MSSKKNDKKNKKMKNEMMTFDRSMVLAMDIVKYIYLYIICSVYLLVMHDKYFDITKTRYSFFMTSTAVFIVCIISLIIIRRIVSMTMNIGNEIKDWLLDNQPSIWMSFFMLANATAYIMSKDKSSSLYGDSGRYMGLMTYLVIGLMFILIANRYVPHDFLYVIFGATALFAIIMSIEQHAGKDVFGLKERISESQYNKFISTFGNINIYAGFVVVAVAVAVAVYMKVNIKKNDKIYIIGVILKVLYAVILVLSGLAIRISSSDSAYFGTVAVYSVAFIVAYREDLIGRFFQSAILIAVGNYILTVWHTHMKKYPSFGGLSKKLDNTKLTFMLLVGLVVLYVIYLVAFAVVKKIKNKKNITNSDAEDDAERIKKRKNIGTVVIVLLGILAFAGLLIMGIRSGNSLFKFNYDWGTYRGYIWAKCVDTFKNAPIANKLFGYGNESIKRVVSDPNFTEMKEVTGKVYDNAHNELLQYLVTLGIFGLISYVGLVVSSLVYIIKHSKKNLAAYVSAFVIVGYLVQSLISLNQPITTPFYFAIMAMGVGYANYERKLEKIDVN